MGGIGRGNLHDAAVGHSKLPSNEGCCGTSGNIKGMVPVRNVVLEAFMAGALKGNMNCGLMRSGIKRQVDGADFQRTIPDLEREDL